VANAERLKRNCCYAVHKFKTYDFPTFKRMIWAVLYQHFRVHDTCGDWCPWLCNKDDPKALEKLFYQDMVKGVAMYAQILEIWNTYCYNKALCDLHHEWNTNKCESINQFITKFVRKNMHLGSTIAGKARTYLAVLLDSISYQEYYSSLYKVLGLQYDDEVCQKYHAKLDAKKAYNQTYDKQEYVRKS
jgi:hypothetical protein